MTFYFGAFIKKMLNNYGVSRQKKISPALTSVLNKIFIFDGRSAGRQKMPLKWYKNSLSLEAKKNRFLEDVEEFLKFPQTPRENLWSWSKCIVIQFSSYRIRSFAGKFKHHKFECKLLDWKFSQFFLLMQSSVLQNWMKIFSTKAKTSERDEAFCGGQKIGEKYNVCRREERRFW